MKNRPTRFETGYYSSDGGVTTFKMTPDEQIRWNHFCRKLGHKPTREDYLRFINTLKQKYHG